MNGTVLAEVKNDKKFSKFVRLHFKKDKYTSLGILLASSSPSLVSRVRELFQKDGVEAKHITNRLELEENLLDPGYQVILVDLQLEKLDSSLLRRALASARTFHRYFIFILSDSCENLLDFDCGEAFDYAILGREFSDEVFLNYFYMACENAWSSREKFRKKKVHPVQKLIGKRKFMKLKEVIKRSFWVLSVIAGAILAGGFVAIFSWFVVKV